jgi:hypothetical protein
MVVQTKNWLVVWNIFPYIGNSMIPIWQTHIFQRGRSTTKQYFKYPNWFVTLEIFPHWTLANVIEKMILWRFFWRWIDENWWDTRLVLFVCSIKKKSTYLWECLRYYLYIYIIFRVHSNWTFHRFCIHRVVRMVSFSTTSQRVLPPMGFCWT